MSINDYMLNTIFGDKSDEVRNTFVQHDHHDIYRMRPEFDTQRKVEAYFAGKTDQESLNLKEGLYSLISNVLFVKDRKNPEMYHPRISVQNDFIYKQTSSTSSSTGRNRKHSTDYTIITTTSDITSSGTTRR